MTGCRSMRSDRAAVLFCLLLAGCGPGDGLATVKGRVTLDGQPLEGALVEFQPLAAGGSPSSAITDAGGHYRLMYTFQKAGALPGEHVVTIRTGRSYVDEEGCEVECAERVPLKYNVHSELKRTVEPGRNVVDFDL